MEDPHHRRQKPPWHGQEEDEAQSHHGVTYEDEVDEYVDIDRPEQSIEYEELGMTINNLKCRCAMLATTNEYLMDLTWLLDNWDSSSHKRERQYYDNELNRIKAFYGHKRCDIHTQTDDKTLTHSSHTNFDSLRVDTKKG
jgi:hypothetical protein